MLHPALEAHRAWYRGRSVCVTGGAGFIGSHLADALAACGASVSVLDNFSNGLRQNLRGAAAAARVVEGSICDPAALDAALAGAEVVFHQAAMGSVPRSVEQPEAYHHNNVTGTLQVLEAARRHKVQRVVYAASSSSYGNTATLPKVETMRPDTLSPYAYTKLAGEQMLRAWCTCYGMSGVSLRYFNIFGPRQRDDSAYAALIPLFAKALRSGQPQVVYGDGLQTRDFTFVANAVHANLLAGAATAKLDGQVANIACGERYSVLDLLQTMAAELGVKPQPVFQPGRMGDVRDSQADIRAASALLGYSVIVPFAEGLQRTLRGT